MLKYLAIAAVAGTSLFMASSLVTPTTAEAYKCIARSSHAYGWGYHPRSLAYAQRRALRECAVRTRRGYTCYITSCNG